MLLRQIEIFVSNVDENCFTQAAEKNFVSQSAISQAMNALETDLGVKMIERKNRSFYLTTAGEYFIGNANRCWLIWTRSEMKLYVWAVMESLPCTSEPTWRYSTLR